MNSDGWIIFSLLVWVAYIVYAIARVAYEDHLHFDREMLIGLLIGLASLVLALVMTFVFD